MVNRLMMVDLWVMVQMDLEMEMNNPFMMVHPWVMMVQAVPGFKWTFRM